MIAMNKKMALEINGMTTVENLPPALNKVLHQGFLMLDELMLLAAFKNVKTNVSYQDFQDKTGYECFINSIHIDDYVASNFLAYACLFTEKCFSLWNYSGNHGTLRSIISCDEYGAVIKIHFLRDSESWTSDNLSEYEDAILFADSTCLFSYLSIKNTAFDYLT